MVTLDYAHVGRTTKNAVSSDGNGIFCMFSPKPIFLLA